MNFSRKCAVRMSSCECTERKLKADWLHFTTAGEVMRNRFMNKRVTVNPKELLLRESMDTLQSHIAVLISNLARVRLNTTSSEANQPTLLYKALNYLKKPELALSKLHLKVQPVVKNTRKYRQQLTQLMVPPEAVVTGAQWILYLCPNRMHCDLFAFRHMSTSFK